MSGHLYTPAYATRLGNLTAKSVLVRICDQANDDDGVCWPSFGTIARDTEIRPRTVLRMMEVFVAMDLLEVKEMQVKDRSGERSVQAIILNLAKLGQDLTEDFARCYAEAQGKVAVLKGNGRWCLRDAESVSETQQEDVSETLRSVSETRPCVSETQNSVSETFPPHPLIGGSSIDPPVDPLLNQNARADDAPPGDALTPEQQEHLDRLAARGMEAERQQWRRYYADEARKADAQRAADQVRDAEEQALRREYPDLETALGRVRKKCGFAWSQGDELGPVMRQVFLDQQELGKPVWRTAAQMVAMWDLQRRQGPRLRARFGPVKFFRDGHWIDPEGWHWNTELLEREAKASVGSAR